MRERNGVVVGTPVGASGPPAISANQQYGTCNHVTTSRLERLSLPESAVSSASRRHRSDGGGQVLA
jgi:hypothetical protein